MQFVKANWILLTCGAVGLIAIVVAVIGLMRDDVVEAMQRRASEAAQINRLRSNPRNEACIEAERQRAQSFEKAYEEALELAAEINRREPLLAGVFPDPAQRPLRYQFKEAYVDAVYELPRVLNAGDLPDEHDVADEQEILADLARRKAEQEAEGGAPAQPIDQQPTAGIFQPGLNMPWGQPTGRGMMPGMPPGMRPGMPMMGGVPGAGGFAPTDEARRRACVRKARNVPIYATVDRTRPDVSFHISPIVDDPNPPTPRDMWYAQVGLWIQQDIVRAIRKLNDEAAAALPEGEAHVGNMPVKRIVSIRVHGYVAPSGELVPFDAAAGAGAALGGGPGSAEALRSFTGRKSDEQFDVVRFTLTAVVDQRDLLQVVDAVTGANFYQLIDLDFTALEPDDVRADGYFYGGEPVVQATLTFEGYMARRVFKEMMPKEVLEALGIIAPAAAPEGV